MSSLARHARLAIGMGLAWAAAWFVAGVLVARMPGFDSDLPFALLFAPFGLATGLIFSGILVTFESRGRLDRLSRSGFTASGAVSGVLLAVFVASLRGSAFGTEAAVFGIVLGIAGALCAARSLAVARRSERVAQPV